MDLKLYLWLVGMWLVGGFVYSIFGLQIAITKNCAYKLLDLLKSDSKNWYPDACKKYWSGIIRKNRIIMWVIAIALFVFIPGIGMIGYLTGLATKWLTTRSKTGTNTDNIEESIKIFMQFAKPECKSEFETDIMRAITALTTNNLMKYT